MDINVLTVFPETFLGKVRSDSLLGTYFVGVNENRYNHMMSGMLSLLFGNANIDNDMIHHLYEHHKHLKCSRADFLRFTRLFEETLLELGANRNDLDRVLQRMRELILMLQSYKQDRCSAMIASLIETIKTTNDLNAIRQELVSNVLAFEEVSAFSGPLHSHRAIANEDLSEFFELRAASSSDFLSD